MEMIELPCAIIRGGTSKGIYIEGGDLPNDLELRDKIIVSLFGSPDPRQIDGLGGADPLTSKVAIVSPSLKTDADVDYTSGEVGIVEQIVNYGTMCGNLASGVGLFAIAHGMVEITEPITTIRIFNINSRKYLTAHIPIENGEPALIGDLSISGVAGTGPEIRLAFEDPAGAITGQLLPTQSPTDRIESDAGNLVDCSIIDAGTLYAFVQAQQLGIQGTETPEALDNNSQFKNSIETLRNNVAVHLSNKLLLEKNSLPPKKIKVAIVANPSDHLLSNGKPVTVGEIDIIARIINKYKTHKAYAVSGAICLSAASILDGTVVNRIYAPTVSPSRIRIGHPGGVIEAATSYSKNDKTLILQTEVKRTARIIMDGVARVIV